MWVCLYKCHAEKSTNYGNKVAENTMGTPDIIVYTMECLSLLKRFTILNYHGQESEFFSFLLLHLSYEK